MVSGDYTRMSNDYNHVGFPLIRLHMVSGDFEAIYPSTFLFGFISSKKQTR